MVELTIVPDDKELLRVANHPEFFRTVRNLLALCGKPKQWAYTLSGKSKIGVEATFVD